MALSADGRHALSGSLDRTLKLWDTESGALVRTFEGHSDSVNAVALNADGRRALSGSNDRTLKLWDTANGQTVASFSAEAAINGCALSMSRPPLLVAGDQSGRMYFLRLIDPHSEPVSND